MATNTVNIWPWICCGGIIVGVLATVACSYCIKKRKHKIRLETPAINVITDEEIVECILPIVKHFEGCMNSFCGIINDYTPESATVTFENLVQIVDAHGDEKLKDWFLLFTKNRNTWNEIEYKENTQKMYSLLRKCGVNRSPETKVKWDDNTAKRYRKISKIENGQICKVLESCWIFHNEVFEKGIVCAIKQ